MSLRIQPVRLYFGITQNWQPPAYTGSLFRGLFGHSLKALCCMLDNTECSACPLRNNCIYAKTFEPRAQVFNNQNIETPPPFVINPPPASPPVPLTKGSMLSLDMHLFGPAIQWLPTLLLAWQGISQWPVDKKNGLITLQKVELLNLKGEVIRSGLPATLSGDYTGYVPEPIQLSDQGCTLQVITPLRLRHLKHNVSANKLSSELFFKALLRRYSVLLQNYGDDYEPPTPEAIKNTEYPVLKHQLHWSDWQRWSNRQQKAIKLGGLLGSVSLDGNLNTYRTMLTYLPWINLGKSCSLGLGQIHLQNSAESTVA